LAQDQIILIRLIKSIPFWKFLVDYSCRAYKGGSSITAPHLSSWIEAGSLVFVSGQLAFDAARKISATDVAGQTVQTLQNVARVLKEAGLSLSDTVKTTVWLRNAADFTAFNEAYARAFGSHAPARSTVVSPLLLPEALVEIEVVAKRPTRD
jgi:2-iminobutanoate/2-iminopropanoate deaminase